MQTKFTNKIRLAWWFWPYVYILAALCAIMGTEPDEKKMERVVDCAIRGNW